MVAGFRRGEVDNGITMAALREEIESVLKQPRFGRNARGRLAAALRVLDAKNQQHLACDFAEHVAWTCEEGSRFDQRFRLALLEVRAFIEGRVPIASVAAAWSQMINANAELAQRGLLGRIGAEGGWAINQAICACCQCQLEA